MFTDAKPIRESAAMATAPEEGDLPFGMNLQTPNRRERGTRRTRRDTDIVPHICSPGFNTIAAKLRMARSSSGLALKSRARTIRSTEIRAVEPRSGTCLGCQALLSESSAQAPRRRGNTAPLADSLACAPGWEKSISEASQNRSPSGASPDTALALRPPMMPSLDSAAQKATIRSPVRVLI